MGGESVRKMEMLIMMLLIALVSMSFSITPAIGQLDPPKDRILELIMMLQDLVEETEAGHFSGSIVTYAERQRSALLMKIHEVEMMFEMENWDGGYYKLNQDIKAKLWDPLYDYLHKRSWLNPESDDVFTFAGQCQGIIAEINMYLRDGTD